VVEGTQAQVEQPKETVELDAAALKAEVEKLSATNARLLAESKDNKSKYVSLKSAVEAETKAKLEKDEDWKSLLEQERTSKETLAADLLKVKKQTLKKSLDFETAKYAKDAYEIDDIINALDKNAIKIDEESLSISGVEEAINVLRNKKPYLFNTAKKPTMVDERPGLNMPVQTKGKQDLKTSLTTLHQLLSEAN
jgi:hypothetical protein